MTEAVALSAANIDAGYGSQQILFGVSVDFRSGQMSAIIGPNGAGKSTLAKALFGLAKVTAGTVSVDGSPVEPVDARRMVQMGAAYVPQVGNVFPTLSVRENLEVGTYVRDKGSIDAVLDIFGELKGRLRDRAGGLSGGLRNMLAVGRALMSDPRVLILDEATAGLAPMVASSLWDALGRLAAEGRAIAVVEQNVHEALERCHNVYLLAGGRNILTSSAADLKARPDFEDLFLEAAQ